MEGNPNPPDESLASEMMRRLETLMPSELALLK